MAALTASRITNHKEVEAAVQSYPVAAEAVFKGGLISINTAGFASAGADTASEVCVGIAMEDVDNSGGSAGDKSVLVKSGIVADLDTGSDLGQTSVGETALISDDQTVALSTSNSVAAGKIVEYRSASEVSVYIPPHGMAAGL